MQNFALPKPNSILATVNGIGSMFLISNYSLIDQVSPVMFQWILIAVFTATLVAASISDMRTGRIPNRLILWSAAILMPMLAALHLFNPQPSWLIADVLSGIIGACALFVVTFTLWQIGGFGGGDVKLLTLIGLVLGLEQGFAVLLGAQLLAAGFVIARRIYVSVSSSKRFGEIHNPVPMAGFFTAAFLVVAVGAWGQ